MGVVSISSESESDSLELELESLPLSLSEESDSTPIMAVASFCGAAEATVEATSPSRSQKRGILPGIDAKAVELALTACREGEDTELAPRFRLVACFGEARCCTCGGSTEFLYGGDGAASLGEDEVGGDLRTGEGFL